MEGKELQLMIGDLVGIKCGDGSTINIKVTAIKEYIVVGTHLSNSLLTSCGNYKDLLPIPLTKETLEKNGFYFGYTANEEDIASNTIAQLSEEGKGWVWDEGAGEVKVIFPNESDGGLVQISDQCFDRNMTYVFVENIMLHELQQLMRLCNIEKEIEI